MKISEAKNACHYLHKLKKNRIMGGRKRIALLDCIECFQYAIDDPHKSLGILRKFDALKLDTQKEDPAT